MIAAACLLLGFFAGRSVAPPTLAFPDPAEARDATALEQAVLAALDEPRGFPRASALIRLFEGLTPENVAGAAKALDLRAGHRDPVDLQLFLTAWAHVDPLSAMQTVSSWMPKSRSELGIRIVMREWAASGRKIEAAGFLQTLSDPEVRQVASGPLIRGWALSGDVEGARGLAKQFWDREPRLDLTEALARGMLQAVGSLEVLEWAEKLEPAEGEAGAFDRRLIQRVLSLGCLEEPAYAAALYARFAEQGDGRWLGGSLGRIAEAWSQQEPRAAAEWLIAREANRGRNLALTEAIRGWALRELEEVEVWIGERPWDGAAPSTEGVVLDPFVRRMAQIDPPAASQWIDRIENPGQRATLINRVAFFWAPQDRSGAQSWVDSLELDPGQRAAAQQAIDRSLPRGR